MGVTAGLREAGDDLARLADDVDQAAGEALAGLAVSRAGRARLSRIVSQPIVTTARATVEYAGVISPLGFAAAVDTDVSDVAAQALEQTLDTTLTRNGL